MAKKPILVFPQVTTSGKENRPPVFIRRHFPSPEEQEKRLKGNFEQIAKSFQSLGAEVPNATPEQVIVFETIDYVKDVAKQAANIEGLEWLSELDLDDSDPDFGFHDENHPDSQLPTRLYAVMSGEKGIQGLLTLWNKWQAAPDERADKGFGAFKNLFKQLRDIRRWNHQDRIAETGVVANWNEELQYRQGQTLKYEIELWHRFTPDQRTAASKSVRDIISAAGGSILDEAAIPQILYHGMLVETPAEHIQSVVDSLNEEQPNALVRCEAIMFIRPQGQGQFGIGLVEGDDGPEIKGDGPAGEPVVALLDGLPLEKHQLLDGRLIIDDPDDFAANYPAGTQKHGSAMASLICFGDRNLQEPPLGRSVYVRPIMYPVHNDLYDEWIEQTPEDKLLIDLIHSAVLRIKKGDGVEAASAPDVRFINLSIGNGYQPFLRELSPLARLLDWLSWEFGVLFIVSAGNCSQGLTLDLDENATDEQIQDEVLSSLEAEQMERRPLSPSEAINIITVGSVHNDASEADPIGFQIDPLKSTLLPSTYNPIASGFHRAVYPDVLFRGGRQFYNQRPMTNEYEIVQGTRPPGNLVAIPGSAGELARVGHTRGTSNATALATRCAAKIYDRLQELRQEPFGDRLNDELLTVLTKALLVHGAQWGDAASILDGLFRPLFTDRLGAHAAAPALSSLKTRFLGYGEVDEERCIVSTDQRVTIVGCEFIEKDQTHEYVVPLPTALSGSKVQRRLTTTLAWFTPVNLHHRDYRRARLWLHSDDPLDLSTANVRQDASQRGTVEHRVLEGTKAKPIGDDVIRFKVSCREQAGKLADAIPYGIAISLEVAEPLETSIYEQIADLIKTKVGIRPVS